MAMPRAAWKGHLKLALVSCPVRLFKATTQAEKLSAHYIHRDTRNRVQMAPHDPMLGKVARTDLIAAYEHLDQYIVLSDRDLAEIKAPSDKTLLIETFVGGKDIDPIYFDQPYFLVPDSPVAIDAFDVLRAAMTGRRKVALGRLVLNRRERLTAIRVHGQGLILTTLRSAEEVRDPHAFFDDLPSGEPTTELLNLAEQLIAMRSGRFDPHVFKDRYQAALKDLVEQKMTYGETIDRHIEPIGHGAANDDEVQPATNLVEAFKLSVDGQRKPPAKSRLKTAVRKTMGAKKTKVEAKTTS